MKFVNFGSLNIDYTFTVQEIVRPGQTISSLSEQRFAGGKGLNQSLAAARAGAEVFHAGRIGDDGAFLKELLEESGVDCRFLRTGDTGTGKAFIQVDASGQNCIVLSGGENQKNTPAFCDEVLEFFAAGDLLLLQNEINCLDYLIDRAYEKGMKIALNPSPMDGKVLKCALDKISMFILNEDEGMRIANVEKAEKSPAAGTDTAGNPATDSEAAGGQTEMQGCRPEAAGRQTEIHGCRPEAEEILAAMRGRYPDAEVILTLGAAGAVYSYKEEKIFQPAFPVKAVDTTGAGDTFTGYFLAGYLKGETPETCLRLAAKAAALAVTRKGAAAAIPWRREIFSSDSMISPSKG